MLSKGVGALRRISARIPNEDAQFKFLLRLVNALFESLRIPLPIPFESTKLANRCYHKMTYPIHLFKPLLK